MKRINLTHYLIGEQCEYNIISAELCLLLEVVARACKAVSHSVSEGALVGMLGSVGTDNVQGETQQKLNMTANGVLLETNEYSGGLATMASEEMGSFYETPYRYSKDEHLLLFDPLGDSSNIGMNVPIGAIFSVLHMPEASRTATGTDFMQPGSKQVAVGYAICGPQAALVLTVGNDVHMFMFNHEVGSFTLAHRDVKIPVDTKGFATNMSNMCHWVPPVCCYVDECLAGTEGPCNKDFNTCWIASMVADMYCILTRGSIFMHPQDKHEPGKTGKLCLMYEANPMASLVEQTGNAATDGEQHTLDIQPEKLHQRVAAVLGSKNEVDRVAQHHLKARQAP